MDDAQRWVAIAADVLGEPDPLVAGQLLAEASGAGGTEA